VQLPAQPVGTSINYVIAATDNNATTTTSSESSYTVVAAAPVLAVTPIMGFSAAGAVGSEFLPSSATYALSNTGIGPLNWTCGKTATWLTLSSTSGSLAAGATTNVSATINALANSLSAASYTDTLTFTNSTTNSTTNSGSTTRTVALTITSGISTNPIQIHLQFDGTLGVNYTLQYSPDLSIGSWMNIGTVTSDGNYTETEPSRLARPKGFYRVVIP
jgi:hypothetical protein